MEENHSAAWLFQAALSMERPQKAAATTMERYLQSRRTGAALPISTISIIPMAPILIHPWFCPAVHLYGTASGGGTFESGTLFQINTDGTGFTNLQNFDYTVDGEDPYGLTLSGGTLFGVTPRWRSGRERHRLQDQHRRN